MLARRFLSRRFLAPYCVLALSCIVGLFAGCDGLLNPFLPNAETGSAQLKRFTSEQDLAKYLTDQVAKRNQRVQLETFFRGEVAFDAVSADGQGGAGGDVSLAPSAPGGETVAVNSASGDESFSGTTIQEVGVDESDVVKTDGTNFYLISDNKLRIIQATPPEAMAELASVDLEGYGQELYLLDNRVVALTQTFGGFIIIDDFNFQVDGSVSSEAQPPTQVDDVDTSLSVIGIQGRMTSPDLLPTPSFERPKTFVTVIDITDPSSPAMVSKTIYDGSMSSSRMIDGTLHVVVSNFQSYYVDVFPELGRAGFNATVSDPNFVLPRFEQTIGDGPATEGPLVTWQELYRPTDPDGFGVVAVVSMDVAGDSSFKAVGVIAEPGLIYSSRKALYLTDTNYTFDNVQRETTDIYKFAYGDGAAKPVAVGTIKGRIINQYAMGEQDDNLRVASTLSATFGVTGQTAASSNSVYVLSDMEGALQTVGQLEGIASGETIQSARFLGSRGYLVTFRRVDPFFTLDLSDPTNPQMIGELKVPGFSTFIVPMDENHLLTVGQYIPEEGLFGPWGVQLSIFDVTDFANPTLSFQAIIGDQTGASSEALSNPKAFTYFAEQDLVALPISIFNGPVFLDGPFIGDGVDGGVDIGVDIGVGGGSGSSEGPVATVDDPVSAEPAQVASDPVNGGEGVSLESPILDQGFEGLVVFRATAEDGFEELGRVSTRFKTEGFFYSSYTRGIFIDDNVFAVTDRGVHGSDLADLSSIEYELYLPPENNFPELIGRPVDGLVPSVDPISVIGEPVRGS